MEILQNNAQTTLNGTILSGATTLVVSVATAFPASGNFRIAVESELMLVTAVSGTTFTITRGIEGTTAVAHASGVLVTCVLTAGALQASFAPIGPTASLTADATNATTTFSDLSDLTVTLEAGQKFSGRMDIKCGNSVPAEGIKFDFDGGSATMTNFWAGAGVVAANGSAIPATVVVTSISSAMNFPTMTADAVLTIIFSIICNAGGTFIPRFAEDSTSVGTATIRKGTSLILTPVN